jgi:hypothetical protein
VPRDIEVLVVVSPKARRPRFRPLPETRNGQNSLRECGFQSANIDRPRENEDAYDDHKICRALHSQPGRIDGRHAFTF